ncbi:MAG: hypothetical protein ACJ72N_20645 [Labedaea sp.]
MEAIVDPGVPLLAPHLPGDKVDMIYKGLDQEPDGDGEREHLRRQRAAEGHEQ